MTSIWWVRDDLRLHDNAALAHAAQAGPVIAVHIDERVEGARPLGGASRWWLHHSLTALAADLREHGIPVVLASGDPHEQLLRIAQETGADTVAWQRRYHLPFREADARIKADLHDRGVDARSVPGFLLHEPWTVRTGADQPYKVYSPFARACADAPPPQSPQDVPDRLDGPAPTTRVAGHEVRTWLRDGDFAERLDARGWLPTHPDWAGGLRAMWTPGEAGARARLDDLADVLATYDEDRDRPDRDGTSRLSPHLRFGEVSPREARHASRRSRAGSAETFRAELLWREFAWHRLFHLPDLATANVRAQFDGFDWREDAEELRAWQRGRTGIDLVDAGMRELWETGTMHNRVRMVVASFLTKNLRLHWRRGEEWFWDTLVDADEASNPFNWQWVAGTGDDAAPYFRVFNPERQQERFDPHGAYVRRWVPEAGTDDALAPIVDLKASRQEALDAYSAVKG